MENPFTRIGFVQGDDITYLLGRTVKEGGVNHLVLPDLTKVLPLDWISENLFTCLVWDNNSSEIRDVILEDNYIDGIAPNGQEFICLKYCYSGNGQLYASILDLGKVYNLLIEFLVDQKTKKIITKKLTQGGIDEEVWIMKFGEMLMEKYTFATVYIPSITTEIECLIDGDSVMTIPFVKTGKTGEKREDNAIVKSIFYIYGCPSRHEGTLPQNEEMLRYEISPHKELAQGQEICCLLDANGCIATCVLPRTESEEGINENPQEVIISDHFLINNTTEAIKVYSKGSRYCNDGGEYLLRDLIDGKIQPFTYDGKKVRIVELYKLQRDDGKTMFVGIQEKKEVKYRVEKEYCYFLPENDRSKLQYLASDIKGISFDTFSLMVYGANKEINYIPLDPENGLGKKNLEQI